MNFTHNSQRVQRRSVYQRSLLPLTHRSQHSGQVGLPLLLVLILRVPDQVCVDGLTLIVALESVQLKKKKTTLVSTEVCVVRGVGIKWKGCKIHSQLNKCVCSCVTI